MKVLVVNCGSSSVKYDIFEMETDENIMTGEVERVGTNEAAHRYRIGDRKYEDRVSAPTHREAIEYIMKTVVEPGKGPLKSLSEVSAVGHRVAHGGGKFTASVLIDDGVKEGVRACIPLAPLHNPANLAGIEVCEKLLPGVPQVAVFDTSFHHTIPKMAYIYGVPYEWMEKYGVRKYGFHGTSHHYVAMKAATHLGQSLDELRLISCHLGNGASVCAIDHGRSVDTSMGLTPLEGLIMGTRCGDLDPGIATYLILQKGMSPEEFERALNRESGLKGISGISNDMRQIEAAADEGNPRALLAIRTFCYRVRKYIGAYSAAMGGVDAVIFTGGIGENSAGVRARACQNLRFMGIALDEVKNRRPYFTTTGVADISADGSKVKILVIPTDEERMIARETARIVGYRQVARKIERRRFEKVIPIGVSARHVHISQEHVHALFGEGYVLTQRAPLRQSGHFVCNESVNLIGPKGKVEGVSILMPLRKETQVEISRTEEFKLGIDAPVRSSGDLEGTPGITLEGPKGKVVLSKGVICAWRHIHMSPADAEDFGLKDKDIVRIEVRSGKRRLVFGDVLVRVGPGFVLEMHIDTDEANAAELDTGAVGYLEGIQERKDVKD